VDWANGRVIEGDRARALAGKKSREREIVRYRGGAGRGLEKQKRDGGLGGDDQVGQGSIHISEGPLFGVMAMIASLARCALKRRSGQWQAVGPARLGPLFWPAGVRSPQGIKEKASWRYRKCARGLRVALPPGILRETAEPPVRRDCRGAVQERARWTNALASGRADGKVAWFRVYWPPLRFTLKPARLGADKAEGNRPAEAEFK